MSPTHLPLCVIVQSDDGTYTGFIKVHLKLRRPVTVPAGIRPQSIYDALKEVNLADTTDRRTSFYLPLDAIKQLHISSTTTVSEVIQGLLKKFMVVDNPQKFALFKEMRKDGQGESVEPHAERFGLEKASEIPQAQPIPPCLGVSSPCSFSTPRVGNPPPPPTHTPWAAVPQHHRSFREGILPHIQPDPPSHPLSLSPRPKTQHRSDRCSVP